MASTLAPRPAEHALVTTTVLADSDSSASVGGEVPAVDAAASPAALPAPAASGTFEESWSLSNQ